MTKLLFLDCDSTLCAIEGVDELAALRGPEVEQQVVDLTNEAMDGTVPIDEIFARRLELIKPSREMCEQVAQMYIEKLSPGVTNALSSLRQSGWKPIIISGGFTQVIEPVAKKLEITDIHAVPLQFSDDGTYRDFDHRAPTARNGGKPDIIRQLKKHSTEQQTVMLGDGVSDWETTPVVDLFIGYGGVVCREKVKSRATAFITSFSEIGDVIHQHFS